MTTKRRSLTPVRRAILVSALAIVAPALVLFFLGLQTLQRQQQTMADLQVTTLALSARQLAAEIELRAGELAETCLRDERLARAALAAGTQLTLETVLDLRALTAEIGADCPLAARSPSPTILRGSPSGCCRTSCLTSAPSADRSAARSGVRPCCGISGVLLRRTQKD
jgi:hypothetical protein